MTTLEETRRAWMDAIHDHSDAVALSQNTGRPIPNLRELLANLRATRCAYFDNYLEVERRANEERRKKIVTVASALHDEVNSIKRDSHP